MKFLIADDNAVNRLMLAAMLKKTGHEVVQAEDGKEAVEAFIRHQPDMIIMDVMMPVMSGYEATERIKAQCGDRFVPVLFLTAVTDEQGLAECITHGGDDFLTKPFNQIILHSKIDALSRIRNLYALVKTQNRELTAHHDRTQYEQEVAQDIFDRIFMTGCLQDPRLRYRRSATAVLNGDFLLAGYTPNGTLHVILGDMAGHGLSAAVGALPIAEVFYDLTARGYGIPAIASAINKKVGSVLPPGMFCAACLLEWDERESRVGVWNGGIPDVLLFVPGRGVTHRFISQHTALGVVGPDRFESAIESIQAPSDCRLYLYSDGLIEAENPLGESFGQDRLDACFGSSLDPELLFKMIEARQQTFSDGAVPHDDVTVVEVRASMTNQRLTSASSEREAVIVTPWRMGLELTAGALSRSDPIPGITKLLTDGQELSGHSGSIVTVLAELIGNAIEHGLLELDSSMRSTPNGFAEYYQAREARLKTLTEGAIRIDLSLQPAGTGGRLSIRIEDSGPGFDWQSQTADRSADRVHSGRGLLLVKSLCREVTYQGKGNIVEAVYEW